MLASVRFNALVDVTGEGWQNSIARGSGHDRSTNALAVQTNGCALLEYLSAHSSDPTQLHDGQSA
jgi:hypothetical protein